MSKKIEELEKQIPPMKNEPNQAEIDKAQIDKLKSDNKKDSKQ